MSVANIDDCTLVVESGFVFKSSNEEVHPAIHSVPDKMQVETMLFNEIFICLSY